MVKHILVTDNLVILQSAFIVYNLIIVDKTAKEVNYFTKYSEESVKNNISNIICSYNFKKR